VDDSLSIPADLDRALAVTVLDWLRSPHTSVEAAPATTLDPLLARIVETLRGRGARSDDVTDALEDAFAALLAGQDDPEHRERVRLLEAHARHSVAALLHPAPSISG
jgi:hypothetical protein